MHSIHTLFKSPALFIASTSFAWFSIEYLPTPMLFFWLVVAVFFDLITGVLNAWSKGISTTSAGFRKTVVKIFSYGATIVVITALVDLISKADPSKQINFRLLIDALMAFMVFIELFSICENIDQAYPNSPLSQYIITPLLKFLKGKLKSNPITSLGQNNNDDIPADKGESK